MAKAKSAMALDPVEIVAVLDRSGSMEAIRVDTEGGFNRFVREQKEVPGRAFLSLYQFDDHYEVVYEGVDIKEAPPLVLKPRGWTALYDAMGKTLRTALARITDGRRVIFLTCTDGAENASREYTSASVAELIAQAKARGWQILFIGANQDAILAAKQFGVARGAALSTVANAAGTHAAYVSLSGNAVSYRMGDSSTMDWTDADREAQAEAAKADNKPVPPQGAPAP